MGGNAAHNQHTDSSRSEKRSEIVAEVQFSECRGCVTCQWSCDTGERGCSLRLILLATRRGRPGTASTWRMVTLRIADALARRIATPAVVSPRAGRHTRRRGWL